MKRGNTYSKGVFLQIKRLDRNTWRDDLSEIRSLAGVEHLEIWLEKTEISRSDIKWLKDHWKPYRIIVHAPFMDLSLVSHHEEINRASLKILKRCIDTSILMGAEAVTVHAGAYPFFGSLEGARQKAVESFRALLDHADGSIDICMENVPESEGLQISYPTYLDELATLKRLVPEIKFTLDVGHSIRNREDYRAFIIENAASIRNIHLHNARLGGEDHLSLHLHGDLDLKELISLLLTARYTGFLSLEVFGRENTDMSWKILLAEDSP